MVLRAFLPLTVSILALNAGCGLDFSTNPPPADAGDAGDVAPMGDAGDGGDAGKSDAALDGGDAMVADADAAAEPVCYLDKDGDGVGAGAQVPCAASAEAGPGASVAVGGDCDDDNAKRAPSLTDVCGDKIDNDCDGNVDDEANNPCGGPCTSTLSHQPGAACSNGLLGACARPGKYVCRGTTEVTCDAPTASGSAELCSDSVDNDCDGAVNEADAVDAPPWYQDCDRDGYAASASSSVRGCSKPADLGKCSWTSVLPNPATKTNWDCNDASNEYQPNYDNAGSTTASSSGFDFNCNGVVEKFPNIFWWPLCAAGEWPAADNNCAYWLDASGKRTNTQPACGQTGRFVRNGDDGEVPQACK